MTKPYKLDNQKSEDDRLLEIMTRAEDVDSLARISQGEACFLYAGGHYRGRLKDAAKETGIRYKTLAERYKTVWFYGGDIDVGSSGARSLLEWGEGLITYTDLRSAMHSTNSNLPVEERRRIAIGVLQQKVVNAQSGDQFDSTLSKRKKSVLMRHIDTKRGIEVVIYRLEERDIEPKA